MLRQLLDQPAIKTVRDATATANAFGVLISVLLGTGGLLFLVLGRWSVQTEFLAAVGGLIAGGLLTWSVLRRRQGTRYKVLAYESRLRIESAGIHKRYTCTRTTTIRALTDGVRTIEFRWNWTGESNAKPETQPLSPRHIVFDGDQREKDQYIYQWLYLGQAIGKGAEETVGTVTVFDDDLRAMRPYWSVGSGARKLSVVVEFVRGIEPAIVEGAIWHKRTGRAGIVDFLRKVDADADLVRFSLEVTRPRRLHQYGFRWE